MLNNNNLASYTTYLIFFVTFWCFAETRTDDVLPYDCIWSSALSAPYDHVFGNKGQSKIQSELFCKLKSISKSQSLLEKLSTSQLERITDFKLECNDNMYNESYLESNITPGRFLGHLNNLKTLSIEYCKIKHVPSMIFAGQRELVDLKLRAGSKDQSSVHMTLHSESFRGLSNLQKLNLAQNNIWTTPADVFCGLPSLKVLNLTGNRLSDISALGLSDWGNGPAAPGRKRACNFGLEILDLSANMISIIPDNVLSAMRSLSELHLNGNILTALADRSFVGLGMLRVVNLSNNKLVALPPDLFQSPRRVEQIILQNNVLTVLAPGLFEGLDALKVLDLSRNELTSMYIKRDSFAGLKELVILNLGFNRLSKIDHHVFRNLYKLKSLNLQHNSIEMINDNVFSDLKELQVLSLSYNKLKIIERNYFSELYVLNQLFLESNQIEEINDRAFENLTQLSDLNLNDNKLNEIPLGMKNLRFLISLDLGKNKIVHINKSSFNGLDKLMGLRLVDNYITSIPRDIFHSLLSLDVLNLASNQIKHIDEFAFTLNPTIRAIRLDNNQLEDISGLFASLPSLIWLNVSDNNIQTFDYSYFPLSLQWLDIHKNSIKVIDNYQNISSTLNLTTLDLSYNYIKYINSNSITRNIETLFLNNNLLSGVAQGTFINKTNLMKVVLYGNLLKNLEMASIVLSPVPLHRPLPEFFISDNLFDCDCTTEWLQRIHKFTSRQYPDIMDLDLVECKLKYDRGSNNNIHQLLKLKSNDFLCKYDSHCFTVCHCCDYDACDCKMTCPDNCSCFYDITWNRNIVDCGMLNITRIPKRIPMDATEIYLDGNNFTTLDSHIFIGKKKLEKLYLNNSFIHNLHNSTFNGLTSLETLHLEHNKLNKLHGLEFNQLNNLNELYLDHNYIAKIGNDTFNNLNFLKILTVHNNKLIDFRPWEQLVGASDSLNMFIFNNIPDGKYNISNRGDAKLDTKNKVNCNCDNLLKLKRWFLENANKLNLSKNVFVCQNNTFVNDIIKKCENMNDLTPIATPTVQRTILDTDNLIIYLPLFLEILLVVIIIIIIVIVLFIFRNNIRLWFHSKYGWRLCSSNDPISDIEKLEENEKLYDSFVIYSLEDSNFLMQNITTELEESGYTVCLHYRDIHSHAYLIDSLQSAAEASRKIVIFVSMNFLQNEWLQPEYKVGLQTVIELVRPSRRRNKLIILTTAPHSIIAMDPIMNILLHTCTVISWNDKKFWKKLRYAMPDIGKKKYNKMNTPNKTTNLRYTPAPTNINTWLRQQNLNPTAPFNDKNSSSTDEEDHQQQLQQQQFQQLKYEQDLNEIQRLQQQHNHPQQMLEQSPQYELPMHSKYHNHFYRDKLNTSLSHVYATIPEPHTNYNQSLPPPHHMQHRLHHHHHHHHCAPIPSPTASSPPPPQLPATTKCIMPNDNRPCFV